MPTRDLIVVGGSAGSIEALKQLLPKLPASLPATVLIVVHTHPSSPGYLPQILARCTQLPVAYAANGEAIIPGHVLIAPPDHHMLVEGEYIRLTRGPKENRSRPAVDPLFRSAAYFFGPRVIGVILSGMLDDGTAGLWTIKDRGGMALVQSPEDAQFDSMPLSAVRYVEVDRQTSAPELGDLINILSRESLPASQELPISDQLQTETRISLEKNLVDQDVLQLGEQSAFTCPECHGVMIQLREGGLLRFRCHTGHAFTANSLLAGLNETIEASLWNTLRSIEESMMLMRHMANHLADGGNEALAARFRAEAQTTEQRAQQIKQLTTMNMS